MKYIKLFEEYTNEIDYNLKEWFGDSKIVDKNDNPLMVYHGSGEQFDDFISSPMTGGIYFSDSLDHAQDYGHSIYKVYLKVENPIVIDAEDKYFDDFYLNIKDAIKECKMYDNDGVIIKNLKDPRDGSRPMDYQTMEWDDYDSATVYIVFNPNQIKIL